MGFLLFLLICMCYSLVFMTILENCDFLSNLVVVVFSVVRHDVGKNLFKHVRLLGLGWQGGCGQWLTHLFTNLPYSLTSLTRFISIFSMMYITMLCFLAKHVSYRLFGRFFPSKKSSPHLQFLLFVTFLVHHLSTVSVFYLELYAVSFVFFIIKCSIYTI